MTEVTKAAAIASFKETIVALEKEIKSLESFFSVTCIDAWPYVVIRRGDAGTISALKVLTADTFNMSAMGRDAAQYSKARADAIAKAYNLEAMGKHEFFTLMLKSKRETLAFMKEMIEKHEEKEA